MKTKLACGLALAGVVACGAHAAQAPDPASYPAKPIRLIVPQAPGGSNDVWARYFGGQLAERLGKQVVVDNRPGADGIIGTEMVAKANPDGYTLLMTSTAFVMNPAVFKLPYDPVKDFDWAVMLGTGPVVITVNAAMPVKTLPGSASTRIRAGSPSRIRLTSDSWMRASTFISVRFGSLMSSCRSRIDAPSMMTVLPSPRRSSA